jgi:hypothetical protein
VQEADAAGTTVGHLPQALFRLAKTPCNFKSLDPCCGSGTFWWPPFYAGAHAHGPEGLSAKDAVDAVYAKTYMA